MAKSQIEDIDNEFKLICEVAEKAFAEENWELAKSLYIKHVQQGKYNPDYLRYNMALCDLNSLTDNNPEKIDRIYSLIKLLQNNGADMKAQLISEKLNEQLKTIKQKEISIKEGKTMVEEAFQKS